MAPRMSSKVVSLSVVPYSMMRSLSSSQQRSYSSSLVSDCGSRAALTVFRFGVQKIWFAFTA
jgi:hypothetical protein